MMTPVPLVKLDRVGREFDGGAVVALHDVSLTVAGGDSIAIVGPSGSGKSTLIQLLCGMDMPSAGTVVWKGNPITRRRQWTELRAREIGVVFQDFLLLPNLTAAQNVEMAIAAGGADTKGSRNKAIAALEGVGLSHRAGHLPYALSGGERQRVAIARGLVNSPELMLVDEPTGSLDSANATLVSQLLFDLQARHGHALVLVTHDPSLAKRCARQVLLRDGRIVERAS
jgi:putative ABC transport system ATP-binding protein